MPKETYNVCFRYDERSTVADSTEIEAFDHEDAATDFAKLVYYNCEMYSVGPQWNGDNAVVVIGPDGTRKCFEMLVEFDPVFTCEYEVE